MIIPFISFIVLSGFALSGDVAVESRTIQRNLVFELSMPSQFEYQNLTKFTENDANKDVVLNSNDYNVKVEKAITRSNIIHFTEMDKNATKSNLAHTYQPRIELGILLEVVENGVKIIDIIKGSPCEIAGFEKGDIFTKYNYVPVTNAKQLADNFRSIVLGTSATVSYIKKEQNTESIMTVNKVKLADGNLSLVFRKIKIVNPEPQVNVKEKKITGSETIINKLNELDKGTVYVPRSVKDKLGNITTFVTTGVNDEKTESDLKINNVKEAQELVQKLKNSDKQSIVEIIQSGKIPINLETDIRNSTSIKEALNKLENAGIKIDENTIQNYLQNNSKQINFNNIKLDKMIPASILSMYGNLDDYRPRNTVKKVKFGDPNASSFIKRLEALNRDDNGRKSGIARDGGISSFNYSRPSSSQNSGVVDSTSTKVSSSDFIPASVLKSKANSIAGSAVSTNIANASEKPVFIPSVKAAEKKVGETFKSNDFVPAPEISSSKTSIGNIGLNGSKPDSINLQTSGISKARDKSVFIASTNTSVKQTDETTRIINEIKAKLNADLRAQNKIEQPVLKTETNEAKSFQEKSKVGESAKDKIDSKPTIKSNEKNKVDNKIDSKAVTQEPKLVSSNIKTDTIKTVSGDKNLLINNLDAKLLNEKKGNPEKLDSNIANKPTPKPVFIPEVKKIGNPDDKKYKSSDFIPASDLTKSDTSKANGKNVKGTAEKLSSIVGEKPTTKPQFIPSTKPQDREASELETLLKIMKAQVNTTLSKEKAKIAATSNNTLENKSGISKEKTTNGDTSKIVGSLRLKYNVVSIEKTVRINPEIPKIFIDSAVINALIYFVPESDRVNNLNWLWLNQFILN